MMARKAQRPSEVFRHRLVEARKVRGYDSQAKFAQRLAEVGVDLNESAIARIESGRRNVKLDEVLGIAAALDVPPVALVLPDDEDARVRLGSLEVEVRTVLQWMLGRTSLGTVKPPLLELDTIRPPDDELSLDELLERLIPTLDRLTHEVQRRRQESDDA